MPRKVQVYIGAVSGFTQYVGSLMSSYDIKTRPGDEKSIRYSTRGESARVAHCEEFLKRKEFDAILMLDLDMKHRPDLLEVLRSRDRDMVTAHYYRRCTDPIVSVCCHKTSDMSWPYPPLLDVPDSGLHEMAITGMGCVLIKREVVEAVQATLPPGDNAFSMRRMPHLSGDYRRFGTDYSFFLSAIDLGYKLWLDASIESAHGIVFWLTTNVANKLNTERMKAGLRTAFALARMEVHGMNDQEALGMRIEALKAQVRDEYQKIEKIFTTQQALHQEHQAISARILAVQGAMAEVRHMQEGKQDLVHIAQKEGEDAESEGIPAED